MLFQQRFHAGLFDGSITLTFRAWSRPQVKAGNRYQTPAGLLEVESVEAVRVASISDEDARQAGFGDREELVGYLTRKTRHPLEDESRIFRVAFSWAGPLEDSSGARQADLSPDDVAEITRRLERLDRFSRRGPWTMRVLELIERQPKVAAANLAEIDGREKPAFKGDIRKLKRLGLTLSHETGYELSPRGRTYLESIRRNA